MKNKYIAYITMGLFAFMISAFIMGIATEITNNENIIIITAGLIGLIMFGTGAIK